MKQVLVASTSQHTAISEVKLVSVLPFPKETEQHDARLKLSQLPNVRSIHVLVTAYIPRLNLQWQVSGVLCGLCVHKQGVRGMGSHLVWLFIWRLLASISRFKSQYTDIKPQVLDSHIEALLLTKGKHTSMAPCLRSCNVAYRLIPTLCCSHSS